MWKHIERTAMESSGSIYFGKLIETTIICQLFNLNERENSSENGHCSRTPLSPPQWMQRQNRDCISMAKRRNKMQCVSIIYCPQNAAPLYHAPHNNTQKSLETTINMQLADQSHSSVMTLCIVLYIHLLLLSPASWLWSVSQLEYDEGCSELCEMNFRADRKIKYNETCKSNREISLQN